ncbi:hypothetical protein N7520_001034 [Penicillium odoratum]|uniref:uncharacterized protein n=1 Tax=Penicillium odoratum TaxID=1167516 RepID=UPI002549AF42|nr:uncharacterized protein N7520_001034 [Penicillium odoratum]KAJ5777788.1 hypothetical protein N7520_001034 [Penicillium odoratum]
MGINDDLSIDGLYLRTKDGREDVHNSIYEEIENMPAGIPRLHRPTAVKNLYEIFRDQRAGWPVTKREELIDEDDSSSEDEQEELKVPISNSEVASEQDSEESASEEEEADIEISEEDDEQEEDKESFNFPFNFQSEFVLYNCLVTIVKANEPKSRWQTKLSAFLEDHPFHFQQSPDLNWIDMRYLRFSCLCKALNRIDWLDSPHSNVWWSWDTFDEVDLESTTGQARLGCDWDFGRAVWKGFEGKWKILKGPHDGPFNVDIEKSPLFTIIIRDGVTGLSDPSRT